MVNKHMERRSPSLIITEVKIKTTVGYLLAPSRRATIYIYINIYNKVWVRMQRDWDPYALWVGM